MKKWKLSLLGIVIGFSAQAQSELGSFTAAGNGAITTFVTDYQALGINPANLGWDKEFEKKRISFGVLEMGFSLHSEALGDPIVRKSFSLNQTETTLPEKIQAVESIVKNGIYFGAEVTWLGFGLSTKKFGGFAFSVRDRMQSNFELNRQGGELLMLGYFSDYFDQKYNENDLPENNPENIKYGVSSTPETLAEIFDGTNISFNWYREFNLGYGRNILNTSLVSLYGGIGVKYLLGIGVLQIKSDGEEFTAFSSFDSEFGINYDQIYSDFLGVTNRSDRNNSIGKGVGVDVGANVVIAKKLKVGVAVNGIGTINWTGKAKRAENKVVDTTYFGGLVNPNMMEQMNTLIGEDGLFDWKEVPEGSKSIATPAVMRIGSSFQPNKIVQVGMDVALPVNPDVPGSLAGGVFGFGTSVKPLPWFRLSAGYVTGTNIKNNYPVGITFIKGLGVWESGIASRDIVSLFKENGSTVSVVTGFLRFRI